MINGHFCWHVPVLVSLGFLHSSLNHWPMAFHFPYSKKKSVPPLLLNAIIWLYGPLDVHELWYLKAKDNIYLTRTVRYSWVQWEKVYIYLPSALSISTSSLFFFFFLHLWIAEHDTPSSIWARQLFLAQTEFHKYRDYLNAFFSETLLLQTPRWFLSGHFKPSQIHSSLRPLHLFISGLLLPGMLRAPRDPTPQGGDGSCRVVEND